MIPISKDEAFLLREHGRGKDVHMSSKDHKAKGKRYWATESFKSMNLIKAYRESIGVGGDVD